jgi:hypothetical protein
MVGTRGSSDQVIEELRTQVTQVQTDLNRKLNDAIERSKKVEAQLR